MSNVLSIEIIESRTAGTNEPFEFSVIASDSYGSAMDKGFPSMAELMEAYPSRLALMEWLGQRNEFSGAFVCKGTDVILDSVSGIIFSGYPEDDSITAIKRDLVEGRLTLRLFLTERSAAKSPGAVSVLYYRCGWLAQNSDGRWADEAGVLPPNWEPNVSPPGSTELEGR